MRSLIALLFLACSLCAKAGELTVHFTGIDEPKGQIMVALYDSEDHYKVWKAFRDAKIPASGEKTVVFADLPPGKYVVSAYQDKNSNGELDKALFGIPTEPYGFSRNPFSRLGAPSFDKAALAIGAEKLETSLDLD